MKTTKKAASAKPAAAAKKAPAAKPVAKPAAKPVAAAKKAPVAKPAAPAPAKKAVEPEVRYRMIQVAAYYEAQKNGFVGDSTYFWTVAEKQIDDMLGL